MRNVILLGSITLALATAIACSSNSDDSNAVVDDDGGTPGTGSTLPGNGSSTPQGEGPAGTGANTGLPCDVQAVIENRCIACHDGTVAPPMLTYEDLVKKSKADPTKTVAELAVIRMKSTGTDRMPQPPALPADPDEIQTFESWVNAGTPRNPMACTDPPPDGGASAGTPGDGGMAMDGGEGGTTTASVCTSGKTWTSGDTGSPDMHPGMACNACHSVKGGPNLRIAGTVYPTAHEPDNCDGKNGTLPPRLTVIVTGADGRTYNMPVNTVGNFFFDQSRPKAPFRAKVTDGTKTRAMNGSVTSGDCNSCHTEAGKNGAPGRIMAP